MGRAHTFRLAWPRNKPKFPKWTELCLESIMGRPPNTYLDCQNFNLNDLQLTKSPTRITSDRPYTAPIYFGIPSTIMGFEWMLLEGWGFMLMSDGHFRIMYLEKKTAPKSHEKVGPKELSWVSLFQTNQMKRIGGQEPRWKNGSPSLLLVVSWTGKWRKLVSYCTLGLSFQVMYYYWAAPYWFQSNQLPPFPSPWDNIFIYSVTQTLLIKEKKMPIPLGISNNLGCQLLVRVYCE